MFGAHNSQIATLVEHQIAAVSSCSPEVAGKT